MTAKIEGVQLYPLTDYKDMRGSVQRIWREDDKERGGFHIAEVYTASVYPRMVKAWHRHKRMTLRYVCIQGTARIGLYDDREGSQSKGVVMTVFLGDGRAPARYPAQMLVIPPMVWNGFQAWEPDTAATILNLPDMAHDPQEIERLHPDSFTDFPRYWGNYEIAG